MRLEARAIFLRSAGEGSNGVNSVKRLNGVAVVVILALIGCSEKKQQARKQGQYLPGLSTPELKKLADKGNAEAAHQMAMRHEAGQGVEKSEAEAARWYRKAADKGFTPSQFQLGLCYQKGRGVPTDAAKAREWFTKAASYGGDSEEHQFFADQAKRRLEKMK